MTPPLNTRRLVAVVLAAFFSVTGILLLLILCLFAYNTARLDEEEEARAALPFHYVPTHFLMSPLEARTCHSLPNHPTHRRLHPFPLAAQIALHMNLTPPPTLTEEDEEHTDALGIALATITTTVTASLLTLVYSWEIRTLLTQLGVLPPVRHFQRYVCNEPGPRLGHTGPTEPELTPLAARNARRGHHRPQSIPPINERNVRAEDEPDMGQWVGEAIAALLQPMGDPPFRDLHPNFELPSAPMEFNPVPSYEVRDPQELPRARPRPPRLGERNSIPFPMMTRPGTNRPFVFSFGTGLPEDTDSDSSDEPGPSQQRGGLQNATAEPDPLADPHPD
ncbi:hypothetical protein ARMGADRAFT_1093116 [Armillaria gallica]|uniref:Uncharacterized protein n=1 Tax=Armillaria gallica TaxID=47427 RepID=A0A2H3CM24_ARMGA|nr:hypothetical protein ARMGADRAFT_1093116 [Armillaria gallica]